MTEVKPALDLGSGGSKQDKERKKLNDCLVAIGTSQNESAFATIYEHFAGRVKSFLLGKGMEIDIAEELMQEIMLVIWRRASSYDPGKAAASTWIFTIARNKRIDYLRGNSRVEVELDDSLLEHGPDSHHEADSMETLAIREQDTRKLSEALSRLPNEQQQVMHLSYFRGQSHGDIALWLDLPVGTVKSRIRLAMQSIREGMQIPNGAGAVSRKT